MTETESRKIPVLTFGELMDAAENKELIECDIKIKQQKEFLIKARGNGMRWDRIAELWFQAGWGIISVSTLKSRHQRLVQIEKFK